MSSGNCFNNDCASSECSELTTIHCTPWEIEKQLNQSNDAAWCYDSDTLTYYCGGTGNRDVICVNLECDSSKYSNHNYNYCKIEDC